MDPAKLYNLSLDLVKGQGVAKDEKRSFELNAKAAASGDRDAVFAMGWYYLNGVGVDRDLGEARKWYRKSARQKQPGAMFSLGSIACEEGKFEEAMRWFESAVKEGTLAPSTGSPSSTGEVWASVAIGGTPRLFLSRQRRGAFLRPSGRCAFCAVHQAAVPRCSRGGPTWCCSGRSPFLASLGRALTAERQTVVRQTGMSNHARNHLRRRESR